MSFDLLAPHYRWMELALAGEKLQRCRTAFLPQIVDSREILILGEGNGRFLLECRKALGHARITCVDASAGMLAQARRRLGSHNSSLDGITFIQADALSWVPPQGAFDLVVTHFFLDCFTCEQLKGLLATVAGACQNHARWLVADFQIAPKGLRRWRARMIHCLMYAFFRLVTRLPAHRLTEPDSFLGSHGFILKQRLTGDWDLLRTDLWERA